ncbi:MAG: DivIVA domain-containing protein [bacterium]|nr:DivIVA domain-containing protein [bacterium]
MSTTVGLVELSPEALRDVRFTERFRGYDAAEVDAFLSEAAEALEVLVTERSAPMAALAAERARLAIEEVRRQTLEEVSELQTRRDELAQTVADLQLMLADRRRGLVEALALIDATGGQAPDSGDGAEPAGSPQDEAAEDGDPEAAPEGAPEGDSFLARLERAAEGGDSSG